MTELHFSLMNSHLYLLLFQKVQLSSPISEHNLSRFRGFVHLAQYSVSDKPENFPMSASPPLSQNLQLPYEWC